MDKKNAGEIINRFQQGTASNEEILLIKQWMMFGDFPELVLSELEISDDISELDKRIVAYKPDREALDKAFPFDIAENPVKVYKLWPRIAIAAAVGIVISGAGLLFYNLGLKKEVPNYTVYKNDIAPGKVGATLTLASGKQIRLSDAADGELAKEAGVIITKTAKGQLIYEIKGKSSAANKVNILSTAKGETYQLRLPDGSLVWLNAGSILKYPSSFANLKDRRVELSGEAYFEIAKDKKHPFLVQSRGQTVKVLGTRFNINSYLNEPVTATTLLEGSIMFFSGDQSTKLAPGEQILASKESITIEKNVNLDNVMDWQNGDFNFDDVKLKAALRKLERWYNIEFVLDSSISDEMEAGGWISRKNNLSAVLKLISKSRQVKFRVEQDKVYVSR